MAGNQIFVEKMHLMKVSNNLRLIFIYLLAFYFRLKASVLLGIIVRTSNLLFIRRNDTRLFIITRKYHEREF